MFFFVGILVVIYTMACAAIITVISKVIYPWLQCHPFWGRDLRRGSR